MAKIMIDDRNVVQQSVERVRTRSLKKKNEFLLEKIRLRDKLLHGIAKSANILLSNKNYYNKISEALGILGEAATVDRVYIFENSNDAQSGELLASQRFEWSKDVYEAQIDNPDLQCASYEALGMQRWYEVLSKGGAISGPIDHFPKTEQDFLQQQGIRSLLVVPILIENKFWGFAGFDDCSEDRIWDEFEEAILRTMAASFGESMERQRTKEAQASEKEHLAVTLRSIADGVIVTNSEGEISMINSAAESLTGWSLEEALGRPLNTVFRLLDRKKNTGKAIPLAEIIRSDHGEVCSVPTTLERKDQTRKLITYSIALLHDSENKVVGAVLVFHDITDQTKFQEEALKANKLESIGILAGGIAHDFNNLLTAVTGNVSLLKWKTKTGEENYELLSETEDALQRVRSLTQQLLTFAKGGAPIKEIISIEEILENTAILTLRGSNVKCNFKFAPNLYTAEVDPGQFSQVIQNLIINAKQAMPKGGEIDISAENGVHNHPHAPFSTNGNFIGIQIKDRGIGIPQEHLQNIFDPYFTTKQKGCGFGLAICYSIIKKHGGHISANSTLGEGTTFDIYLPATQKAKTRKKECSEKLVSGQGNVLVMDDEETVRKIAGKILKKLGYDVSFACNGEEAIQSYRKAQEAGTPYNAVILDLTIPGEEGGEKTLEKLLEIDPGVKAIASSGYSNAAVMSNYEKYGFKGVVAKPYRITDLSQVLHGVLQV